MVKLKIAVTGHRGRLGTELIKLGGLPLEADITHRDQVLKAVNRLNPDVIINCAGMTDVDRCEESDSIIQAYQINTFGVANLISGFGGKLVQLSTDYIFDGKNGPYKETDRACPISTYGFSKHFAEYQLRNLPKSLIIRTTILYGGHSQTTKSDFVRTVRGMLKAGKLVKCPDSLIGNPTHVQHLAVGILDAIHKNICGVLNVAGLDRLSRYELAQRVAIEFGFDASQVVRGEIYGSAKRPVSAGFVLTKARELGIPLFDLASGLKLLHGENDGF
jgi:dTDP-4-dehydrorhamnose reductase